jgi:hypothetical protein
MMARNRMIVCVLVIASGCGDSRPLPGQPEAAPAPVPRIPAPPVAAKKNEGTPSTKTKDAADKPQTIQVKSGSELTRVDIGGSRAVPVDLNRDKPTFYPVLRNFEDGDLFTKKVVYTQVAPGLGIFACRKIDRPGGGMGIDYVMNDQLTTYGLDAPKLIEHCYENFFKNKIEVKVLKQGDDTMFAFSSSGRLVTAILGHSSTYEKFSKMVGSESIAILIDGPDILLATVPGNSFAAKFDDIVKKSQHKNDPVNLDPAVYHWSKKDGLKRVSETKPQRSDMK